MLRASAVASLMLDACHAFGQPASLRPEFEVASIQLNKSFTAATVPFQYPIDLAYHIQDSQLSGARHRFPLDRYEVECSHSRFMILPGHIGGQKVPIAQFVDSRSRLTSRVVLDKTNLKGEIDINLDASIEAAISTALEGPVNIVDHLEQPSEN